MLFSGKDQALVPFPVDFFGLFFYTSALFLLLLGVWVFPEDAGAAVDPVVGAGAFGRAGAELVMLGFQTVCQRLIVCWEGPSATPGTSHMDPSPGGTGKQEQEWGEAKPQRGECHNGGSVTLRDN